MELSSSWEANILEMKINLNYMYRFSSYCALNTFSLGNENQLVSAV